MKKYSLGIAKIVVSLGLIPLWFLKIFHGVGHLPSQDEPGKIVEVDFYHSMFENIHDMEFSLLMYLSFALTVLSVVFSIFAMKSQNKNVQRTSHIVSAIMVLVFLVSLLVASTVGRGY